MAPLQLTSCLRATVFWSVGFLTLLQIHGPREACQETLGVPHRRTSQTGLFGSLSMAGRLRPCREALRHRPPRATSFVGPCHRSSLRCRCGSRAHRQTSRQTGCPRVLCKDCSAVRSDAWQVVSSPSLQLSLWRPPQTAGVLRWRPTGGAPGSNRCGLQWMRIICGSCRWVRPHQPARRLDAAGVLGIVLSRCQSSDGIKR